MKRLIGLVLAMFVALVCVPIVSALSLFIPPGSKAESMGSAYFAVANDATAIYWNPAGLSQLKKSGAELSVFYFSNSVTASESPLPGAQSKEFKTSAMVPFAAGFTNVSGITIAAGFYGVGGGGGKWEDGSSKIEGEMGFTVANVSAAKEICSSFSAGLGIDFVSMFDNEKRKITILGLNSDESANGYGVQLTGGVIYKPIPELKTALVARSGAAIKLSGKAKLPDAAFETDFDRNYAYPLTYGIGAAYDPNKKWTVAAGIDVSNYSALKSDITYKTQVAGVFDNTNENMKWKDTASVRAGAEYRPDDKLSFRGGFQIDPAPSPNNQISLFNTNQYNATFVMIGAGYNFGTVVLNGSIAQGFSDKPSLNNVSYEYPLSIFRIDVSYNF